MESHASCMLDYLDMLANQLRGWHPDSACQQQHFLTLCAKCRLSKILLMCGCSSCSVVPQLLAASRRADHRASYMSHPPGRACRWL